MTRNESRRSFLRRTAALAVAGGAPALALRPALADGCDVSLRSGNTRTLLADLAALALDVVLTTEVPSSDQGVDFAAHPERVEPEAAQMLFGLLYRRLGRGG